MMHSAQTGSATAENGDLTGSILCSPLLGALGVRHGFTTRLGGVSQGRFASLNLGERWGDAPDAVAENLTRVAGWAGFAPADLCQVSQIHSARVIALDSPERRQQEADGMVTNQRLALAVYSADCVPVLLADGHGRVAAVHAGWRGTLAGIAAEAVAQLERLGALRDELRAVLWPSIGPCCFEVNEDVAALFRGLDQRLVWTNQRGRLVVDLWQANCHFLLASGLSPTQIELPSACTCCNPERFFSYRRDGSGIGQHMAFIVGGGT